MGKVADRPHAITILMGCIGLPAAILAVIGIVKYFKTESTQPQETLTRANRYPDHLPSEQEPRRTSEATAPLRVVSLSYIGRRHGRGENRLLLILRNDGDTDLDGVYLLESSEGMDYHGQQIPMIPRSTANMELVLSEQHAQPLIGVVVYSDAGHSGHSHRLQFCFDDEASLKPCPK
jgi:hypothetical protein